MATNRNLLQSHAVGYYTQHVERKLPGEGVWKEHKDPCNLHMGKWTAKSSHTLSREMEGSELSRESVGKGRSEREEEKLNIEHQFPIQTKSPRP